MQADTSPPIPQYSSCLYLLKKLVINPDYIPAGRRSNKYFIILRILSIFYLYFLIELFFIDLVLTNGDCCSILSFSNQAN